MSIQLVQIQTTKRLYVNWQDLESRAVRPVAVLELELKDDAQHFTFAYLQAAERLTRFRPFAAFPDLHKTYESRELFPFFRNRIMRKSRPEYIEFVESLDLEATAEPFDILQRSGGGRETDGIEVFAPPQRDDLGYAVCMFFARGLRHIDGALEAVASLVSGSKLRLVDDPSNPVNHLALHLCDQSDRIIGFVPDYLVEHTHAVRASCGVDSVEVVVERNNSAAEVPPNRRLLCRMQSCWPEGYEPFSSADYALLGAPLNNTE